MGCAVMDRFPPDSERIAAFTAKSGVKRPSPRKKNIEAAKIGRVHRSFQMSDTSSRKAVLLQERLLPWCSQGKRD